MRRRPVAVDLRRPVRPLVVRAAFSSKVGSGTPTAPRRFRPFLARSARLTSYRRISLCIRRKKVDARGGRGIWVITANHGLLKLSLSFRPVGSHPGGRRFGSAGAERTARLARTGGHGRRLRPWEQARVGSGTSRDRPLGTSADRERKTYLEATHEGGRRVPRRLGARQEACPAALFPLDEVTTTSHPRCPATVFAVRAPS